MTDDLTPEQELWLMTAHPDTWELAEASPELAQQCLENGLAVPAGADIWKLTPAGHRHWLRLRGQPPLSTA